MVDPNDYETAAERLRRIHAQLEPTSVRMFREQQAMIDRVRPTLSVTKGLFSEPTVWDAIREQNKFRRDVIAGSAVTLAAKAESMSATGRTLSLAAERASGMMAREFPQDRLRGITQSLAKASIGARFADTVSTLSRSAELVNVSETMRAISRAQIDVSAISQAIDSLSGVVDSSAVRAAIRVADRDLISARANANVETEYDPDEAEELLTEWVLGIMLAFAANSKAEIQSVGILRLFALIAALVAIQTYLFPDDVYSEAERQADTVNQEQVVEVKNLQKGLAQAIENLSRLGEEKAEWIDSLERANVTSDRATVRELPMGNADVLAQLETGENIAIIAKDGHWFYIVYQDRLTGYPTEGWIYESSIELLNPE